MDSEPEAVAAAFLAAYNEKDFELLEELLAAEVALVHYNRPIAAAGRAAVIEMLRASAAEDGAFPDRRFRPPRRRLSSGELALIEHVWEASARRDVEGLGRAGERVRIELVTIFTVHDGHIVRYEEYG